jgi:hypothetical protein
MLAGAAKVALFAGDVTLAVGGVFPVLTVMFTPEDVPVRPRLSVARAVKLYEPAATFVQENEYGDDVSSPSFVVPWKNSTFATDPLSEAVALIVIFAGAVNEALLAGDVMLAVGGVLPALTVMFTPEDVPVRPKLSVARAVKLYEPVATFVQENEYGDDVSSPSFVVPWKNSTFATDPLSEAVALIVIFAGAVNEALLAGDVMLAVGGGFPVLTVIFTTEDVPVRPKLSVARAVKL